MAIIITTNCPEQTAYWQKRLPEAHVVYEDWPGGAGNGLGTLYAVQKSGVELTEETAIALYHTAGKGTRLAPLPGSEWNNKSAVKLPGKGTLLEAVMEQTAPLLTPGRLSVFWGDQLFFPSIPLSTPTKDVEIFAKVQAPPTRKQWEEQRLELYGLLFIDQEGCAQQMEKIDFETYEKMRRDRRVGVSLGSFSLSLPLLTALLETFSRELAEKRGRQDTDRDWWMPQRFGEIGVTDIGADATWWDFGNLKSYHQNCLKLATGLVDCEIEEADVENSVLVGVKARRVYARNAVIIDAQAPQIEVIDGLLYNARDDKPITLSKSARADAHGMAFIAPLEGADWETPLPGNPMSFADLYRVNASQPVSVTSTVSSSRTPPIPGK